MHNWCLLLLAFLAGFQPITSFTKRNLVDGREQCCDRDSSSTLRDLRENIRTLHEVYRFSKPLNRQREVFREIRQNALRDGHSFARNGETVDRIARIGNRKDRISDRQYRERFSTFGDREYFRDDSRFYSRSLERPERIGTAIRENFERNTLRQNNHRTQFARVSDNVMEVGRFKKNARSIRISGESREDTQRFRDTAGDVEIREARDSRNLQYLERDNMVRNDRRIVSKRMVVKLRTSMSRSEDRNRRSYNEDTKRRVLNSERPNTRLYQRQTYLQDTTFESRRILRDLHSRVNERRAISLDRNSGEATFSRHDARDLHTRDNEKQSTALTNGRILREASSIRRETGNHYSKDNERQTTSLQRGLKPEADQSHHARNLNLKDNDGRSSILHRSSQNRKIIRETATLRRITRGLRSWENESRFASSHKTSKTHKFQKARDSNSRDNERRSVSLNRTPENRNILRESATNRRDTEGFTRGNERRSVSLDRSLKNRQIFREKSTSRDNSQKREYETAYRRQVVERDDERRQHNEDRTSSRRRSSDRTSSLRNSRKYANRVRAETRFDRTEKLDSTRHDKTTRRINERVTRLIERRQVSGKMVDEYARSSDNESKERRSFENKRDDRRVRSRSADTMETRERFEYRNARYNDKRESLTAHFQSNVVSARNRENFMSLIHKPQDREAFTMNWQYIFYTLQGIYLCSILMEMLTGHSPEKTKRSLTLWPSSQISMKMD